MPSHDRELLDDPADAENEELWQIEINRRAEEALAGHADLEDADAVHARLTTRLRTTPR